MRTSVPVVSSRGRRHRRASCAIMMPKSGAAAPRAARSSFDSRMRGTSGARSRVKPHQTTVRAGPAIAPGRITEWRPTSALGPGTTGRSSSSHKRRSCRRDTRSWPRNSSRSCVVRTASSSSSRPRAQVPSTCIRASNAGTSIAPSRDAIGSSKVASRTATASRALASITPSCAASAARHASEPRPANLRSTPARPRPRCEAPVPDQRRSTRRGRRHRWDGRLTRHMSEAALRLQASEYRHRPEERRGGRVPHPARRPLPPRASMHRRARRREPPRFHRPRRERHECAVAAAFRRRWARTPACEPRRDRRQLAPAPAVDG